MWGRRAASGRSRLLSRRRMRHWSRSRSAGRSASAPPRLQAVSVWRRSSNVSSSGSLPVVAAAWLISARRASGTARRVEGRRRGLSTLRAGLPAAVIRPSSNSELREAEGEEFVVEPESPSIPREGKPVASLSSSHSRRDDRPEADVRRRAWQWRSPTASPMARYLAAGLSLASSGGTNAGAGWSRQQAVSRTAFGTAIRDCSDPGEIDASGKVGLGLRIGASTLPQDLAPAPLCASVLAGRLAWYTGWDCGNLNASMTSMSASWERIAGPG